MKELRATVSDNGKKTPFNPTTWANYGLWRPARRQNSPRSQFSVGFLFALSTIDDQDLHGNYRVSHSNTGGGTV
jgi:hypothetical protein